VILLYHRIGEARIDPWALTVTPAHFAEHIEVLQRGWRVAPLAQLLRILASPESPAVALTFDDGYPGTLHYAKPILERVGVPSTVFVPTGVIGSGREFWWDELARLTLGGSEAGWRAWEPPPTSAARTYLTWYDALLSLPDGSQQQQLRALRGSLGSPPHVADAPDTGARPGYGCLSAEEVYALASDLIEIGAHTVSHPVLARLPPSGQSKEIRECRRQLEAILDRPVTSFAYPYGQAAHYTAQTVEIVREAGYAQACINMPGSLTAGADRYQLPRIQVHDWNGDTFAEMLSRWLPPARSLG
jgi:Predicted xylanase/chitin deacetylase